MLYQRIVLCVAPHEAILNKVAYSDLGFERSSDARQVEMKKMMKMMNFGLSIRAKVREHALFRVPALAGTP